ncbi:hypothetical protein [uncultured Kordia sp.]|uniref:hypothetical protein n=1 Tax=uncultured Kordia sp. TaxID=507699 RepID=UPI002602C94C|nr:hypothetical protein [uncultured Kordia sp.]
MSNRPAHERGILFSIILGILGHVVSAMFFYAQITPDYEYFESPEKLKTVQLDTIYTQKALDKVYNTFQKDLESINADILISNTIQHTNCSKKFHRQSEVLTTKMICHNDNNVLQKAGSSTDIRYAKLLGNQPVSVPYFLNKHPKVSLWILFISLAIGFSMFFIPYFYIGIRYYAKRMSKSVVWGNVGISLLIAILLILPLFFYKLNHSNLLFKPTDMISNFGFGYSKATLFTGATLPFFGVIFWMVLVLMINSKISYLFANDFDTLILKFKPYRDALEKYFIIIALFLAFTIFCTDTLLRTLNSLTTVSPNLYPTEFAYSNGLIHTFFLVLIYLGIHSNLNYIKQKINENATVSDTVKDDLKEQKSFISYLKVILTMLAPVIGSGVQEIIGLVSSVG